MHFRLVYTKINDLGWPWQGHYAVYNSHSQWMLLRSLRLLHRNDWSFARFTCDSTALLSDISRFCRASVTFRL